MLHLQKNKTVQWPFNFKFYNNCSGGRDTFHDDNNNNENIR